MASVVKCDPRDVTIGGVVLTAVGANVVGDVAEADVVGAFSLLDQFQRGTNWNCGDLQLIGARFGEDWVQQQLDTYFTAMSPKMKMQCQWVAARYEQSNRLGFLSWTHHLVAAGIKNIEDRQKLLNGCRALDDSVSPVSELRRSVREYQLAQSADDLPGDTYRVIYADPPWRVEGETFDPFSLSAADMIGLKDGKGRSVRDLADKDAVLSIWAPPRLPEALEVMAGWGFRYCESFVWKTDYRTTGRFSQQQHELLLVGTRGECEPRRGGGSDSILAAIPDFAGKPERFRELFEEMFPDDPKIELFTQSPRLGWDSWGMAG